MIAVAITLAALGTAHVPANARNLTVRTSAHGAPLRRVYDPAVDTCSRQWAFVDTHGRTLAESVGCWHELDNWTRRALFVRYTTKGH